MKIIHLNYSFFWFRIICCNMILFTIIKINIFVNILLLIIVDDMMKKKQKIKTYKSIEKRMKRIVLMYENKLFRWFFEFFSFLWIFRVTLWRLFTQIKYVLISFNVFKSFKKLLYMICNWKKTLLNNAFIIFNWFWSFFKYLRRKIYCRNLI